MKNFTLSLLAATAISSFATQASADDGIYNTFNYNGGEIVGGSLSIPIYSSNHIDFFTVSPGDGNMLPDKFSQSADFTLFITTTSDDKERPFFSPIFPGMYTMRGEHNNLTMKLGAVGTNPETVKFADDYEYDNPYIRGGYLGIASGYYVPWDLPGSPGKTWVFGDYNDVTAIAENPVSYWPFIADTIVQGSFNTVLHHIVGSYVNSDLHVIGDGNTVNVKSFAPLEAEIVTHQTGNDSVINATVKGGVHTSIEGDEWMGKSITMESIGDRNTVTSLVDGRDTLSRDYDEAWYWQGKGYVGETTKQTVVGNDNNMEATIGDGHINRVTQTIGGDHNVLISNIGSGKLVESTLNAQGNGNTLITRTDQTNKEIGYTFHHRADLKVSGDDNVFVVKQVSDGFADPVYSDPANTFNMTVVGNGNHSGSSEVIEGNRETVDGITQIGQRNHATAEILGNDNELNIRQVDGAGWSQHNENNLTISVHGRFNNPGTGNKITARQMGANLMGIIQSGNDNVIEAYQGEEAGEAGESTISINQTGNGNHITATQLGRGNIFGVLQYGNDNTATLTAESNGNALMARQTRGSNNTMTLKAGDKNSFSDNNTITGIQNGSHNEMTLISNTSGAIITGRQNGSYNVLNLTVNRPDGVLDYTQNGGESLSITLNPALPN